MSKKSPTTDVTPTELEAAVLGDVWKNGPCTAYSIRQHFLRSPSPRWSGSAGAIYPLIRRLETKGLVESTVNSRGHRKQNDYHLTKQGRTVFRRWLRRPIPEAGTEIVHDPLRTKMFFLDALTPGQAMTFVTGTLEAIRSRLCSLQLDCENHQAEGNQTGYFAARNALLITEARINWLEEVLQELKRG